MIGSNKSLNLSIVLALCVVIYVCQVVTSASTNDGPELKLDPSGANATISQDIDNSSQSSKIFDYLWTPIRVGMRTLRHLFGSRMDAVEDRIKQVREKAFNMFMRMHNKRYSEEEKPRRLAQFIKSMNLIEQSKKLFEEGKQLYMLGPNRFVDMNDTELKSLSRTRIPDIGQMIEEEKISLNRSMSLKSFRFSAKTNNNNINDKDQDQEDLTLKADQIPKSKDWRVTGCISTPMDQGSCGSCYAVSTMAAIESTKCIHSGSASILSPQHIVDCARSSRYNANGCDGGWPTSVFRYLQDTGKAYRDKCYPYKERRNYCSVRSHSNCEVNPSLSSNGQVKFKVLTNENDILYHVAKTGPVVTAVQTTNDLLLYAKGILNDRRCTNRQRDVDHAFLIVGYGEEKGVPYWLIKNSWGTDWGENGYLRIKRGTCSIGHWGWVMTG